jgi:hypothetical protein
MREPMRDQILERLQKDGREFLLILLQDVMHRPRGLQRLSTLRMADLGEHETSGGGSIEAKFD